MACRPWTSVENDKSYEITAEVPGMDQKNIEIKLSNGSLIIKGEKHEDKEEKHKGYHLSERHYGSFERVFNLPKGSTPTRSTRVSARAC
jgi:HSP20 family protein